MLNCPRSVPLQASPGHIGVDNVLQERLVWREPANKKAAIRRPATGRRCVAIRRYLSRFSSTEDIKHELQKALGNTKKEELKTSAKPKTIEFVSEQIVVCQWAYATVQCARTLILHRKQKQMQ